MPGGWAAAGQWVRPTARRRHGRLYFDATICGGRLLPCRAARGAAIATTRCPIALHPLAAAAYCFASALTRAGASAPVRRPGHTRAACTWARRRPPRPLACRPARPGGGLLLRGKTRSGLLPGRLRSAARAGSTALSWWCKGEAPLGGGAKGGRTMARAQMVPKPLHPIDGHLSAGTTAWGTGSAFRSRMTTV